MKLTNRQLYDYRDIDPLELKLIRAGHYIWRQIRRERRLNGGHVPEEHYLWRAVETIVEAKRIYRIHLKAELVVSSAKIRDRFRPALPA